MEYLDNPVEETIGKILCCECGVAITPNPSNMCVACLRTHVDITSDIPKQVTVYFCRGCERYLNPPAEWIRCALESRELLTFCLKKLKALNKVKLVDAGFIWTEPHSKRIKVKLTVHGEVIGGVTLEQVFVVEYTVANQMCTDCHRTEAQDFWRCQVQVRQRTSDKKTFFYLEQLMLKHRAHKNTLGIKPQDEGLDFFYSTEGHARKMVDFVRTVLPVQMQESKKLISHDIHSNSYNYKFTWCIEIVPLSKDSVVCLPKKLANQLGSINQICVVSRITNSVHLIHPATAQVAEVSANVYWRTPFLPICNGKQLTEFTVLDIEVLNNKEQLRFRGQGAVSHKHLLADAWVVKSSELGINDNPIHTRTHLGGILKPGDSVLGYFLSDFNVNDDNYEKMNLDLIPDVILIKKYYGDRVTRRKMRMWKLKHLNDEMNMLHEGKEDFQEFLEDLEEDPAYRQNVNIFKDDTVKTIPVDNSEGFPTITLEEMLEDLQIDDDAAAEDSESLPGTN